MPTTTQRPYLEPSAASPAADDVVLIDGATNGTRALPMSYFAANFAPIPNLDREIRLDGPVAYWPMTEASGNFQDAIYGGRDLTPVSPWPRNIFQLGSGVAATPSCVPYYYATTADNPLGLAILQGSFTIELIVSIPDDIVAASEALFFLGATPLDGAGADTSLLSLEVLKADRKLVFRSGEHLMYSHYDQVPLARGVPYHVTVVRDGSKVRIYVNGTLSVGTPGMTASPSPSPVGDNARVWVHVSSANPVAETAEMSIGYLAVYNKALAVPRILAHSANLARP